MPSHLALTACLRAVTHAQIHTIKEQKPGIGAPLPKIDKKIGANNSTRKSGIAM